MLFICYKNCSTCAKAQKYLENKGIQFEIRDIKENNPTKEELRAWHNQSGLDLKKFFNTSGLVYKSLNLKEKLPTMPYEEQLELLASNGMLVKRPILIGDHGILLGFKEKEWDIL